MREYYPTTPKSAVVRPQKTTPDCSREYIVKKGDSLFKIGRRYGVSIAALVTANNIVHKDKIFPGQKLCIPHSGVARNAQSQRKVPSTKQAYSGVSQWLNSSMVEACEQGSIAGDERCSYENLPDYHQVVKLDAGMTCSDILKGYGLDPEGIFIEWGLQSSLDCIPEECTLLPLKPVDMVAGKVRTPELKKKKYFIQKFAGIAVKGMNKYGIPASITLAQAIHESSWGGSSLARKANNFFGHKCHGDQWTDDGSRRITMRDDRPDDCFRMYDCPEASIAAHFHWFQINKRYHWLQKLASTDYVGWANGLQQCGYATDPKYAAKLIRIIRDNQLDGYDRLFNPISNNFASV